MLHLVCIYFANFCSLKRSCYFFIVRSCPYPRPRHNCSTIFYQCFFFSKMSYKWNHIVCYLSKLTFLSALPLRFIQLLSISVVHFCCGIVFCVILYLWRVLCFSWNGRLVRLAQNPQSSCLSFLSAGITGVHHYAQFSLSVGVLRPFTINLFMFELRSTIPLPVFCCSLSLLFFVSLSCFLGYLSLFFFFKQ
jgi:hypothetical protein